MSSLGSVALEVLYTSTISREGTSNAVVLRLAAVVAIFWLFLRISYLFSVYYYRRPHNVLLASYPTIVGSWVTSLYSTINTPGIISRAYSKARGDALAVPTLENYHIYVSNLDQIKDLNNAPKHQLSFNGVLAGVVFPKYTMHGYSYSPEDPHNNWSVSTLKSGLRSSLPSMRPDLQQILEESFSKEISGTKDIDGWVNISPSLVAQQVACNLNSYVILGKDLSRDPLNIKAASNYARDAVLTTETLQRIPTFLHPVVGNILMRWSGAGKRLQGLIEDLVRRRLSQSKASNVDNEKPVDLMQWLIDSPRRDSDSTVLGITQRTIGFVFGSAYQMPMFITFVLYCLCKHPEYVEPLREEISSMSTEQVHSSAKNVTPLLDSFLRETARLFPLQTGNADRKVMTPFTFSDGTHVPAGNIIRIAQQSLMLDSNNYSNPNKFDGFRFITNADGVPKSQSRFSHPSPLFPFWGSVGRACPGRFYVSMIVKMTVVHVLTHYDLKLVDESVNPTFFWGTNIVPSPWLRMLIRPRAVSIGSRS